MLEVHARRIRNALWGLFVADALAMPAHWIYRLENIEKTFGGWIEGYVAAPHPHPESFMVGMAYEPDVETARAHGRPFDILHEHARFYRTPYSTLEIERTERETEHGNVTPRLEDRYHYHHGLQAGENTLGAHLVRVLLRSVARRGRYDEQAFLDDFVEHLTTPGQSRDPYTEIYIRRWFENYSRGLPPEACAEHQRRVWSIGSHGGAIRAMVVSTIASSAGQGLGLAIEHQNLTHRSENLASALGVLVPLFRELQSGADGPTTVSAHAARLRIPRMTGEQLFATYREHKGPGNIPPAEMWRLHTALEDEPYDVDRMVREREESEVVRRIFANACYTEHGVPLLLYHARKHALDVESSLLANANAGGDNVHRGMILGLVVGAANDEIPDHLMRGLLAHDELEDEIEAFVDVALSGRAI